MFPNKAGFKTCFPGNHLAQGKFFGTPSAKHKASLSDFQYISYAFNKYDPIFFLRGLQVPTVLLLLKNLFQEPMQPMLCTMLCPRTWHKSRQRCTAVSSLSEGRRAWWVGKWESGEKKMRISQP